MVTLPRSHRRLPSSGEPAFIVETGYIGGMSAYKNQQHRLVCGGRHFHFVSYEARAANEKRGEAAIGPMWYLMGPGKRWPAVPHDLGRSEAEIANDLLRWIKSQGMDSPPNS